MTRRLTTREELAAITRRRAVIADYIARALVEDLSLAHRQDILLDRLGEQLEAERPDRMV